VGTQAAAVRPAGGVATSSGLGSGGLACVKVSQRGRERVALF